jgi:hypothetical protein
MGIFGTYTYKTKEKVKWYLHVKENKKVKFYYFSKDAVNALPGLPRGMEVMMNERTGLPLLRKKGGTKKEAKSEAKT